MKNKKARAYSSDNEVEEVSNDETQEPVKPTERSSSRDRRRFQNALSRRWYTGDVVENILAKTLDISMGQMLALSPELRKKLSGIMRERTEVTQQNVIEGEAEVKLNMLSRKQLMYSAGLCNMPVEISGQKIQALIDGGSEITTILRAVHDNIGEPIDKSVQWSCIGVRNTSVKIIGCNHKCNIIIGNVKTILPVFVNDQRMDMILRANWNAAVN